MTARCGASWACGDDRRLIVTTDRLSAFDRVLAGVPYKGQVLNQLSAWWFERTADVIANHVIDVPDPNALLARAAAPLPVEVVVRGHITGVTDTSLWGMYSAGARAMYGYDFPDGLRKNTPLPEPHRHAHDEGRRTAVTTSRCRATRSSSAACSPAELWERVMTAALAIFARGVEVGERAGLILADTKYEFGHDRRRRADPDRRGAHARLVALVGRRHATTTGSPPGSSRRASTRRSSGGRSPTSATRATGRCRCSPTRCGPRPRPATSPPTSGLTDSAFEPGAYPVADRLTANLTKAGLL